MRKGHQRSAALVAVSLLLAACSAAPSKPNPAQYNVSASPVAAPTPLEKFSATMEHGLEWVIWIPNNLFAGCGIARIRMNGTIPETDFFYADNRPLPAIPSATPAPSK